MAQSKTIILPVGRYVLGNMLEKRKIDFENRPIPEDKQQFEIAVAVRKDNPQIGAVLQEIAAHAFQEYAQRPDIQQRIGQYNFEAAGFSWKIGDGDAPNRQGKQNENTVGHWVFYFKSSFAIHTVNQQNADIPNEQIKRGYFVDVAFTCAGNGEQGDRAGIYLNPQIVRLVAFGEEIRGGISADQAFGGHAAPAQLPPGASMTPVAGAMALPQQHMPGFAPPAQQPQYAPPAQAPGFPQQMPAGVPSAPPSTTGFPGNGYPPQAQGFPPAPGFANGPQGSPPGFPPR